MSGPRRAWETINPWSETNGAAKRIATEIQDWRQAGSPLPLELSLRSSDAGSTEWQGLLTCKVLDRLKKLKLCPPGEMIRTGLRTFVPEPTSVDQAITTITERITEKLASQGAPKDLVLNTASEIVRKSTRSGEQLMASGEAGEICVGVHQNLRDSEFDFIDASYIPTLPQDPLY